MTGFLYLSTHTHTTQGSTYPAFQLVWCPYLSLYFFLFLLLKLIHTGILWEEEINGKYYHLQFLCQFQWNFTQRTLSLWGSCPLEIPSLNILIILLRLELQLKYNLIWRIVLLRNGHLSIILLSLTYPDYTLFQDMKPSFSRVSFLKPFLYLGDLSHSSVFTNDNQSQYILPDSRKIQLWQGWFQIVFHNFYYFREMWYQFKLTITCFLCWSLSHT